MKYLIAGVLMELAQKDTNKEAFFALKKAIQDLLKEMGPNTAKTVIPLLHETFVEKTSEKDRKERFPSKEKHYSRNLNMPLEDLPGTPEEAEKWGWDDDVAADCHQFTSSDKSNMKYVSPDGRSEAIFDSEGDLVTAPEDYGTYNFSSPNEDPVGHFYMDVLPWLVWGNEENDSTTASKRLHAFVVDGGRNVVADHVKQTEDHPGSAPDNSWAKQQKTRAERVDSEKLYYAIGRNKIPEVKKLLDQGAQINALRSENPVLKMVDFENIYPIEKACKTSYEMASFLLDEGADADVIDPHVSSTPLICALSENYEQRFELGLRLVRSGVRTGQVDSNGRTALNKAAVIFPTDGPDAREAELELVKYLLQECDLESVMAQSGTNPLVEAARFDNIPVMEYILDNKLVDIDRTNAKGFTPLMKAVLANCEAACRLLLSRGADISLLSPTGKTAADYAEKRGNVRIQEMFDRSYEEGSISAAQTV